MLLLDSDILIDVQRGYPAAVMWFGSLDEVPTVPGFVVMELIQDAINSRQVRQVWKLISPLTIVWPSEADCDRALSDFNTYHLSHGLGLLDALIAATALGASATLCTFNVKHFRFIQGLSTLQPYSR